MIPAAFDYVAPTTVEEALSALAEHGDEAKIIAGGQSLLPVLRMRLNAPEMVIDLGRIDSLRGVRDDGDAIVIGAMTPHSRRRVGPARRRARRTGDQGGRAPRRRPGPAPRHVRRRAGARRPGRRPRRSGTGAGCAVRDRRVGRHPDRRGAATSSSTSSRPRSATTRSSPRSGSPSTRAGARTTRSSSGSPTSGRSSRSRRRSGSDGGTIAEARVGLTNMGSTPVRARGRRGGAGRAAGRPRTAYARRPRRPPTAPTRRPTSTATPTTGATSPRSSPGGPCSPRPEAEPLWS